ncbi:unnamed protein product, partial [Brenthis ino]
MAVFSSHEDEILIELVSKNAPLFDTRLQAYKDNTVRDNIWEEIGKALNKTKRASVATVEAENTEGSESGEETSTTGISEQRRRSEEISGEERSNEEVKRAGISAAGTSGTKRNAERSGVTSNEEASGPGKGTAETSGRKKKKTCQLDSNLHISSLLQHWKERDKQRQEQMKIMAEEEEKADKDGINSFCSHIGTI